MADFTAFVQRANALGMEVALDLALQCAPDHPWVTPHPEWFTTKPDGTIAYAENPPKKPGCASSASTTRTPNR